MNQIGKAKIIPKSLMMIASVLRMDSPTPIAKIIRSIIFSIDLFLCVIFPMALHALVTDDVARGRCEEWITKNTGAHISILNYLPSQFINHPTLYALGWMTIASILLLAVKAIVRLAPIILYYFAGKLGKPDANYSAAMLLIKFFGINLDFESSAGMSAVLKQNLPPNPNWLQKALKLIIYIGHAWTRCVTTPIRESAISMSYDLMNRIPFESPSYGSAAYQIGLIGNSTYINHPTIDSKAYFEKASDRGIPEATFELGLLYSKCNSKTNLAKALDIVEYAIPLLKDGSNTQAKARYTAASLIRQIHQGSEFSELKSKFEKAIGHLEINLMLGNSPKESKTPRAYRMIPVDGPEGIFQESKELRFELIEIISNQQKIFDIENNRKLIEMQLHAAQIRAKTIEDMMSMFAHQFRGSVDSINFNTEHQKDERVYIDAARTMSGLLDLFGVVSTAPERLKGSIQDDLSGDSSPYFTLLRSFKLAMIQLLSRRNIRRMSTHYWQHALRHDLAPTGLSYRDWRTDPKWETVERSIQTELELQASSLAVTSGHDGLTDWVTANLFPVSIIGFTVSSIRYADYGRKEALLVTIFTEILVNAIKHNIPGTTDPMVVSWVEGEKTISFICENASSKGSRAGDTTGSGRGHGFLDILLRNIGGKFVPDVFKDRAQVLIEFPKHLMTGTGQ